LKKGKKRNINMGHGRGAIPWASRGAIMLGA